MHPLCNLDVTTLPALCRFKSRERRSEGSETAAKEASADRYQTRKCAVIHAALSSWTGQCPLWFSAYGHGCNSFCYLSGSLRCITDGVLPAAAAAGQKGRDQSAGSEEWCSGSEADDSSDDEGTEGYKKGTEPCSYIAAPNMLQVGIYIQACFTPPYHPWQSFS